MDWGREFAEGLGYDEFLKRHGTAEQGILALREVVDALIGIPNERLM